MCRMLAVKSETLTDPGLYFLALKRMAEKGLRSPHGDGFGFAYSTGNEYGVFKSLKHIWDYAPPFMEINLGIFHARKASPGYALNLHHVHPFVSEICPKTWLFAHNGTIHGIKTEGIIDSQYFFKIILEELMNNSPESALLEAAKKIENERKFSSLTCILSDLENIWVMKYCAEDTDKLHTLFYMEQEDVKIISSEPIDRYVDGGNIKNLRELNNREVIKI
ncbi:hypothetical protein AT15_10120 [Kosmotoga arenicorallina S304]|uniref:Glutamine amidotransferase type-2 domain-containing protein n=1 Tax=Kosmotoga arenicorallina S304 TaxID=1453497 RepID=A0A176K0U8_9BACT|nr:class II glutamine amidotransferase [Kosmotoga arenicorallina]OAA30630.1 hypothetical protein AT15_10120 [Kosmotoga arenicorallina S304]